MKLPLEMGVSPTNATLFATRYARRRSSFTTMETLVTLKVSEKYRDVLTLNAKCDEITKACSEDMNFYRAILSTTVDELATFRASLNSIDSPPKRQDALSSKIKEIVVSCNARSAALRANTTAGLTELKNFGKEKGFGKCVKQMSAMARRLRRLLMTL